jgi:hypothetical protein
MTRSPLVRALAGAAIAVAALACGPRETPEQKLEKVRLAHEIIPIATKSLTTPEGEPFVIVDLHVTNHGTVALDHLTVLVRIRGEDGVEKASERVTLDLEGVRPGVGAQRDVRVEGLELGEQDEVLVELETNLPADVLHSLPEWQGFAAG